MLKRYITQFPDGTQVSWRPLTWGEYKSLQAKASNFQGPAEWLVADTIAGLCILDFETPYATTDSEDLFAGVVAGLAEVVVKESGFLPEVMGLKKQLSHARQRIQGDYFETAAGIISVAFHIKLDEIQDWTLEKMMDHLAILEILGYDIEPKTEKEIAAVQSMSDQNYQIIESNGQKIRVPKPKARRR